MTEKRFTDIGYGFKKLAKVTKKFNQTLAKTVLSMPIPMNYETWSFLHEIADGDDVEIDLNECGDVE